MPNWKIKTPRDAKYLNWLRGKPCVRCQSIDTIAHHSKTGGMSLKCSDYDAIPACNTCHNTIFDKMGKRGDLTKEQLQAVINRLNSEYGRVKV